MDERKNGAYIIIDACGKNKDVERAMIDACKVRRSEAGGTIGRRGEARFRRRKGFQGKWGFVCFCM